MIKNFNKYFSFTSFSFHQGWKNRGTLIGKSLVYLVVISIFAQLWKIIIKTSSSNEVFTLNEIILYIAINELIVIGNMGIHHKLDADIRSGNIAIFLNKPINYLFMVLYDSMGITYATKIFMLILCSIPILYITNFHIPSFSQILVLFFAINLSTILLTLMQTIFGLFAFWLQDTYSLVLINQKFLFVLGGLFVPLDLFPNWMQMISKFTPYPAILYNTASLIFTNNQKYIITTFSTLIFWIIVISILIHLLYKKCIFKLEINGG